MSSVPVPAASNPMRPVLPSRGAAKVKSVLSGDTVVLLGRATTPGGKPPEVVFTFERVTAPRMASKANDSRDEPGAFPAREWLRGLCVGKTVSFETRKQGATAGDRVYGLLFFPDPSDSGSQMNLAVEAVRRGFAIPKVFGGLDSSADESKEGDEANGEGQSSDGTDPINDYERLLQNAFQEAKAAGAGVHGPSPLVRSLKNAGDEFETLSLVEQSEKLGNDGKIKCVIEHIFDGSRYRCLVSDPIMEAAGLQYASFTLILAGVTCPRLANPRVDPTAEDEPYADEARQFVEVRLLHRELEMTLHGTDKSGICAVGTVHHPRGNISVELLKNGLAKMSERTVRMMKTGDVPALRFAENAAKRSNLCVWQSYEPPKLSGASEITGTVVEVLTGDTLTILESGSAYDDESKLKKVSLASIRSPRVGNEKYGKPDEPYSHECKDRLRVLTVGKPAKVTIHYERDIPVGQSTETRQFGTVSVGKREDIGEVLVAEGLAVTQRHRDEDEKSPRYDLLCAAETAAKEGKKGVHSDNEYGRRSVNDLTEPRKAKSYSGALMRAGTLKGVVEYVFNGSRFKMFIPSENCHIVFALANLRCPQPSPNVASTARGQGKPAEPFGDASKRHARLSVLQRNVEIICTGVTMGGVITGQLFVGSGGQRRDYSIELVSSGLSTVDQRKIDYGEAPKVLVDAQSDAQSNKVGIWSLKQKEEEVKPTSAAKRKEEVLSVQLSEIRNGNHFFFQIVGDEAAKVVDESMKLFTENNGTEGAPCDVKNGKLVAALFDDGNGKSWYRAKILEKKAGGKVKVVFVDHGNIDVVPLATHLRPLDTALGTDRIPAVAKEAELALTLVRSLDDDEGIDAARKFQSLAWGKNLTARSHCEIDGKLQVTLYELPNMASKSINEQLVVAGHARAAKQPAVNAMVAKMVDGNNVASLAADLAVAQEEARKSRSGMWRYGDIGDDDEEM